MLRPSWMFSRRNCCKLSLRNIISIFPLSGRETKFSVVLGDIVLPGFEILESEGIHMTRVFVRVA